MKDNKKLDSQEEIAETAANMTSEEIVADKGKITADEVAALTPPKSVKRSKISYERRKGLYGYGFIGLWLIGTIYFFILPTINSLIYSFNKTAPKTGYMEKTFIGLENYVNAVVNDSNYTQNLTSVLGEVALKTPLIIIFSIFVAIILNQKFKGRTFARAVFFLPVIIATGPVFDIINGNMNTGGYAGGAEQFSTLFETDLVNQLLSFLGIYNISESVTNIITTLTDSIFNLIWNAGIQILLFIAALQNIPHSAKEAAQMEGATSWEFFWKITIPYISPMILASLVYTVVDSFVDPTNAVMQQVTTQASSWKHGYSAAMAWFYFGIVAIVLAIIVLIVNKFVYYEVE